MKTVGKAQTRLTFFFVLIKFFFSISFVIEGYETSGELLTHFVWVEKCLFLPLEDTSAASLPLHPFNSLSNAPLIL
jgi:hypothetical protein